MCSLHQAISLGARAARCVALAASLGSAGCVDMVMDIHLRLDGSGSMAVAYIVVDDLLQGRFAEVERNDLLPLSEEEIVPWASRMNGVRIVRKREQHFAPGEKSSDLVHGFRQIEFTAEFDNIEAFSSDHFKFAFYPWGDRRFFQFHVFKNVPGYGDSITDPNQIVNTFAHSALQKRNLTIRLALPGKVLRHNADSVQWSDATWTIPMTAIAATAQPELVAWAEMPALASDRWVGMAAPLWYRFSGQAWRNPDTLPEFVVAPGDGPS